MTLLFVALAFTWAGVATCTYLDGRSCRLLHGERSRRRNGDGLH